MASVKKTTKKTTPKAKAAAELPPTAAEIKAWRAAARKLDVRIEIRDRDGVTTASGGTSIPAGRWYAVVPVSPSPRPYQFVLQWQGTSKKFILSHLGEDADAARLPLGRGWIRSLDAGRVHVIASDQPLTRRQLAAVIGGHEPNPGTAKPPNT
jgi:hypothetical protein